MIEVFKIRHRPEIVDRVHFVSPSKILEIEGEAGRPQTQDGPKEALLYTMSD